MDVTVDGQKRKVNLISISFVVLVIIGIVLFAKPGIQGYSVYLQAKNSNYTVAELGKNLQALQHKLELSEQNLSMQNSLTGNVIQLVEKSNAELITCKTENTKLQSESKFASELCDQRVQNLQQKIAESAAAEVEQTNPVLEKAQTDLKLVQDQLVSVQSDFNVFAENTARSVCCKQKFDNPNINSYSIINNKLVCLESGGAPISCSLG